MCVCVCVYNYVIFRVLLWDSCMAFCYEAFLGCLHTCFALKMMHKESRGKLACIESHDIELHKTINIHELIWYIPIVLIPNMTIFGHF